MMEMSESKPLWKATKDTQTMSEPVLSRTVPGELLKRPEKLTAGHALQRWHDHHGGSSLERGNLYPDAKGAGQAGGPVSPRVPMLERGAD